MIDGAGQNKRVRFPDLFQDIGQIILYHALAHPFALLLGAGPAVPAKLKASLYQSHHLALPTGFGGPPADNLHRLIGNASLAVGAGYTKKFFGIHGKLMSGGSILE
jgi:hypothetical protein